MMARLPTDTSPALDTEAGQAVYTPLALKAYDLWVLGISNHLLWRCPTAKLRELYTRNVQSPHLDVGVGTGYFLKHATWPVPNPDVTLFDLNENSLAAARARIAHLNPETRAGDIFQPIEGLGPFQSAGLCFLLHCLPGTLLQKAVVLDNVSAVLAPGGRIFGATIVQGNAPRSHAAQKLMDFYNARGIFSNASDTEADLASALRDRFGSVSVELCGCVALFSAIKC